MNQDIIFRAVLGAGFLAILVIMLYHRLRSWESKEQLDRRQEGLFILATLRPIGLAMWLAVIAYLINPAWMAWSSIPLPAWLRWSGAGVLFLGVALLAWTLRNLGVNLTDTVVTRQAHTLITQGPYRWVRHPFYDALALFVVGFALITANWFILATGALTFLLLAVRSQTEESLLLARFGEGYRSYQKSTGRFLPRWHGRIRGEGGH
jgi:protein-S-isoprenylcysteine O-methyltransferase Ste14